MKEMAHGRSGLRFLVLTLATGLRLASAPGLSVGQGKKSSGTSTSAKDLAGKHHNTAVDVIVQFRPGKASHTAIHARGGSVKDDLPVVDAVLTSLPVNALEGLANDLNVIFVSPDREIHSTMDYANPTIGANIARSYEYDGTGIGVAVIDSGVSDPPDLSGRIVYSETFIPFVANEKYGHGTHVAGIIAGTGSDSSGKYLGVAPGAKIINFRVLDDNGTGTDSTVIKAIDRAISLKSKYNIRVMNLSLGRSVFESYTVDPLCQAVERAWKAGIVVVTAAGNEGRNNSQGTQGYGTTSAPGNDPYLITVGAMKTEGTVSKGDDLIASYSSKGPTLFDHIVKPDIVAPGNRTVSVLDAKGSLQFAYPVNDVPASYYQKNGSNSGSPYYILSGTSMAAAVVSGGVAD